MKGRDHFIEFAQNNLKNLFKEVMKRVPKHLQENVGKDPGNKRKAENKPDQKTKCDNCDSQKDDLKALKLHMITAHTATTQTAKRLKSTTQCGLLEGRSYHFVEYLVAAVSRPN